MRWNAAATVHPDPPRQILLTDGRRLGWSEYGDTGGLPLVYCHGFPASRLEGKLLHEEALRLGIRVISPDRPGFGASDFLPGRSLPDWAGDLAALADRLELERFALLGLSGGGPYALAAAHRLPGRLTSVALSGSLAPLVQMDLLEVMGWFPRASFRLVRRHPAVVRIGYGDLLIPLLRRRPGLGLILLTLGAPAADRQVLSDRRIRAVLTDSMREAFRAGSTGALHELALYARPWGFDPAEITRPVTLWQGLSDATVPAAHGRWLAGRLPDCRANFVPEEGHFSLPVRHAGKILEELR